ncbi:MAG: lipoyl(octanoyl) transferase LipB [Alphaproteobacteria bacterium]
MAGEIEWRVSDEPVDYPAAVAEMEARVAAIHAGTEPELIWLLQHPPLYTAGTSAKDADLLPDPRFPVHRTGRGGQYTYHGPGQRVIYVLLDLHRWGCDVRGFVGRLEAWTIAALAAFNLRGELRPGRIGVWVDRHGSDAKIAAIGVRIRHWISFHGISINVEPDLSHYAGIVPCGISDAGVTSLVDMGLPVTLHDLDVALQTTFAEAMEVSEIAGSSPALTVT